MALRCLLVCVAREVRLDATAFQRRHEVLDIVALERGSVDERYVQPYPSYVFMAAG
jgi:hypothetical protein